MPPQYASCEEIFQVHQDSSPGYYDIKKGCSYETVYCSFEYNPPCGDGPWIPLVLLDMSEDQETCPTSFEFFLEQGVRGCVIPPASAPGCASVKFGFNDLKYTKVCGRAIGYQVGSPDAFGHVVHSPEDSIDSNYVDGLSITQGNPRLHIWTYAACWNDMNQCPCQKGYIHQSAPSYVGHDFYCESGTPTANLNVVPSNFYPDDALWDGLQCGQQSTCCTSPVMPWFVKSFNSVSNDAIEVRICQDEIENNERVVLSLLELYVQ